MLDAQTSAVHQRRTPKNPLTTPEGTAKVATLFHLPFFMSRICQITGARPIRGSKIHRRGLAKKKGGIGMHVTAVTKRWFYPNLHNKRIFVPELDRWVNVKVNSRALKTIAKNGAYATLLQAGLIKPLRARSKRTASSQTSTT